MEQTRTDNMTVSELRKICRNLDNPPASGVAISGANKDQLLAWLNGREIPSSNNGVSQDRVKVTETPPAIQEKPLPASNNNGSALDHVSNLQSALQPFLSNVKADAVMDEARIVELIKQHQTEAREIIVKPFEKPSVNVGTQHKMFDQLLLLASQKIPAFLAGPSGSGKTHAAEQLAKALSLPYEAVSVGPNTSKADLIGYKDANGNYHDTGLIRCVKNGGVFLIDEIDAGHAGVLTILNMVLSNGLMATPEGMIKKHDDFYIVAGANTYGTGADREYVGRCQLDEATLKRFFVVEWGYDEKLERAISGADDENSNALVDTIQAMRKNADEHGLRVTVSPRDSIYAVRLLKAGMPEKDVLKGLIFKGLDKATISKLKG